MCGQLHVLCRPTLKKMAGGKAIRRRAVPHILEELRMVRNFVPKLKSIFIYSDDFLLWPEPEIDAFAKAYAEDIQVPFSFLLSPRSYQKKKMELLLETGYVQGFGMGIQSGSAHIRELYGRKETDEQILSVVSALAEHGERHGITPVYDFIVDCPWETEEDRLATLKMIASLPKPKKRCFFP